MSSCVGAEIAGDEGIERGEKVTDRGGLGFRERGCDRRLATFLDLNGAKKHCLLSLLHRAQGGSLGESADPNSQRTFFSLHGSQACYTVRGSTRGKCGGSRAHGPHTW